MWPEPNIGGPRTNTGAPDGNIRIVIADDHPIFREGVCRLLCLEQDFDVVAQVEDGSYVWETLQHHKPDILLLDLNMPGLGGLATLERLQAANNNTRVIVLTASDSRSDFIQALKLGSWGIVQKQTATELLIDSIRRVHAGELWMDSLTTAAVIQQFVSIGETSAPPQSPPLHRHRSLLSDREHQIVSLIAQGFRNAEIATRVSICEQTVKNHLHNIFDKLGVTDRLELALYAVTHGLYLVAPAPPSSSGLPRVGRSMGSEALSQSPR